MMGTKKLSEIRKELHEALRRDRVKVQAWLDEQMAKLKADGHRDPKVIEDLYWIRDDLRRAVEENNSRSCKMQDQRAENHKG